MPKQDQIETLAGELERQLTAQYGRMLGSGDLWRELGFASPGAFRKSLTRGSLMIPLFEIEGRRGRYALARDIAAWIAKQRLSAASELGIRQD